MREGRCYLRNPFAVSGMAEAVRVVRKVIDCGLPIFAYDARGSLLRFLDAMGVNYSLDLSSKCDLMIAFLSAQAGDPIEEVLSRARELSIPLVSSYCASDGGFLIDSFSCEDPAEEFVQALRLSYSEIFERDIVAFDVETTGLNSRVDAIVEIGAVRTRNGIVEDVWSSLVDPRRPIPPEATAINSITDDMVRGAPEIGEALGDFLDFVGDATLAAHNLPFDLGFVREALAAVRGCEIENDTMDTLEMSRRELPFLPNHKLPTVAGWFGVEIRGYHRALADAMATSSVLFGLINYRSLKKWGGFQSSYRR
ncbi:MAG: 3'-5' exonuclease [bacterium]